MNIVLIVLLVVLLCAAYVLSDGDLASPMVIMPAVYVISVCCALVNTDAWSLSIHENTFLVLVGGVLVFIACGMLCKVLFYHPDPQRHGTLMVIGFNKAIFWVLAVACGVTTILTLATIWGFAAAHGAAGSMGQVTEYYRMQTSYGMETVLPGYLDHAGKLVTVCGCVAAAIMANNVVARGRFDRGDRRYLLFIGLFAVMSLFSSNRLNLLYLAAWFFVSYIVLASSVGRSFSFRIDLVMRMVIVLVIVLLAFYAVRLLVGRSGSEETSLVDYVTMYAGGSIKLLDMFLQDPVKSDIWGKETFISLMGNLKELGIVDFPAFLAHKEFRYVNGISLGNVYTAYRSWFADFGFAGVFVLNTFMSLFFNCLYYRLKDRDVFGMHKFTFILYLYLCPAIFLHSIDDCFFKYVFCFGFLAYVAIFLLVVCLLKAKPLDAQPIYRERML